MSLRLLFLQLLQPPSLLRLALQDFLHLALVLLSGQHVLEVHLQVALPVDFFWRLASDLIRKVLDLFCHVFSPGPALEFLLLLTRQF